jgi:TRAP-type transport system small permease protein
MKTVGMKKRITAEEVVAVACLAALVVITLLNVVTRYVTQQSYAWTEEISIVLIEALYDSGSPQRRRLLQLVSAGVTALVFAVLTLLFLRMVADEMRWSETSMGLGLPRWWFTACVPLLTAALTVRALVLGWRAWHQPPS